MNEFFENSSEVQDKEAISIQLASPDVVRGWSYGEVTKPETINYRSFKPEKDGLFCERIFGPVKNWECSCGKYKRIRYRGVVCDRCGVEVTHSKVRRERMGHIELAVPVVHIWFFKSLPSVIGSLLGMSVTNLERVIYYESYIVLDPGDTDLKLGQLISEDEYIDLEDEGRHFDAKMGASAIKQLLAELNPETLSGDMRKRIKDETSSQRKQDLLKRLKVVEAFRKSPNRPEWMVLDVLPVIPPDLRPLVPLEGGRFATSDLNDLYRRVINRNNRLKKLIDIKAPEVILRNEKRMLQEAVDVLFDNGRRTFSVKGENRRPLKSLSELLKGKQGRFRQNLLGKRVDYSGRSVIVVGPDLKIHQCGLPKPMALELYKPFIIQKLEEKGFVHTVKSAKKFVEKERPEVWDILEEIIDDHPVLLNRAPTLHRLGIQAFYPKLVEGKAIRLHPLVCTAFNADFDGDQMAIHLPLSFEAQLECRILMMSSNNILHPASGQPIAVPSQDIVLGCYYLTAMKAKGKGAGKMFSDANEAIACMEAGGVELHVPIKIRLDGVMIETSVGRVILNQIIPKELGFLNKSFDKKTISATIDRYFRIAGNERTCAFLDNIKELGFKWATKGGMTVAINDMIIPPEKYEMIKNTKTKVDKVAELYENGVITDGERYNQVIDLWSHATNDVATLVYEKLAQDRDGFNPVYMMAVSGARGSREQIKQLSGMRGLMAKPQKKITGHEIIENPILSCFREGLNVLEYFISTHGARKGLADTALKTADAGYLTRRLVDVAQDVVVNEEDCGTVLGLDMTDTTEGDDVVVPLGDKILGRVACDDIYHPVSDEVICHAGELFDEVMAEKISQAGIESVKVRSVLTCEALRGVCAKCYGRNLANGRMIDIGEAVGVMAAQSIGEPGTQLTLRTFHIGGAASRMTAESAKKAKWDCKVVLRDVETVANRKGEDVVVSRSGEMSLLDEHGITKVRYVVPYGAILKVKDGAQIKAGTLMFEWDPYNTLIITRSAGIVEFDALKDGVTYVTEYDDTTGMERLRVIRDKRAKLHPHVIIMDPDGKTKLGRYAVPENAYLQYKNGDTVFAGEAIVKIARAAGKTRDITGGLPRVAELFEARRPKSPAVVSAIDGIVAFGEVERGQQRIMIEDGEVKESYLIPRGKHVTVHPGDRVRSGDKLCDGPIDPHDILHIAGDAAVQRYLVEEIQAVYRLQGVTISDKHIESIVRQMLRKVAVENPGDTELLEGEEISKARIREENLRVVNQGLRAASFRPMLLGITKASLGTDSFISAASFQETTKVLTNAAIAGKIDTLEGLKENVIMGRLIPSGTGNAMVNAVRIRDLDAETEEVHSMAEIGQDHAPESSPETSMVSESGPA
ncbi:MAG TPA: DNA-directed RNA polymerase subunit beta' [Fibrobacteria bacterium]|nr:DNA-directed RNA polymerase subunit beta' [Fibrobacteria bacterium]